MNTLPGSKDHRPKKKTAEGPCPASSNALFHCVTGESKWCPTSKFVCFQTSIVIDAHLSPFDSNKNKADNGRHGICLLLGRYTLNLPYIRYPGRRGFDT